MHAVTHLATSLQLSMSLQDTRNISSANTGSARGRGRGRGRGGGSGQGGRGRGRNIYLGSYSPDQWRKLSSEDKKRVQEGRQKSAEQRSQTGNQKPAGNRNLSTITTGMPDIDTQSQITIPTALVDSQSMANISTSQASQDNKRANPESAGSAISRRRLAAISSSIRKHTTSHRQVSNATSNRNSVIH